MGLWKINKICHPYKIQQQSDVFYVYWFKQIAKKECLADCNRWFVVADEYIFGFADAVLPVVYNVMKVSAKNSVDVKKSLNKRTHSTNKFLKNNAFYKESRQANFILTKSHTLRMMPVKQRKSNNFIHAKDDIDPLHKTPRDPHKKNKTIKIQFKNANEQFLLKKSDKIKLLYWNKDPALLDLHRVIVSADFVIDQDHFWENNTEIEDDRFIETNRTGIATKINSDWASLSLLKQWRQLHKSNFVIWTIRRKSSLSKLQQYVSFHGLALHAIFYIKRKKGYTVDYTPIQREIQKRQLAKITEHFSQNIPLNIVTGREDSKREQLTIFETVKVNLKDKICYESYRGKVPVLTATKAKVLFNRIQNQPPGLQGILRCLQVGKKTNPPTFLSQTNSKFSKLLYTKRRNLQIFQLFGMRDYLNDCVLQKRRQDYDIQIKQNPIQEDWEYEQQQVVQLIEQMKKKLIVQLIEDNGRQYQFEGGSSIYNFVGQMFKRNYKILYQLKLSQMGVERRQKRKGEREVSEQIDLELRMEYLQFELK